MTKEITKARILQEIEDKFALREFAPAAFLFDETVVPVYNIEQHLKHWEARYVEVSITSATFFEFFTVPPTERWLLRGYNVIFMAAGAYKVTGLYIRRQSGDPAGSTIYLDMKEGQTVSYSINLPTPVALEPEDRLAVLIDNYTSTAALRLYIDIQKEEIR